MSPAGRFHAGAHVGVRPLVGLVISLALHALVIQLAFTPIGEVRDKPAPPAREPAVMVLLLSPLEPAEPMRPAKPPPSHAEATDEPSAPMPMPVAPRQPAVMAAPPAPTAEQWAFASTYQLKNSKGYRYTWGQQVRSMMGTAVEGPDQGMVRFRVEIAPDGRLARLETLWSTSPAAEDLARRAIGSMPQWPRTPTGRPLIFEKTISFSPFAADGPPLYQDDCLPDPPAFTNPFVWDGKSDRVHVQAKPIDEPDPQTTEDCLKQLPRDSIDAESARDQRLMDQWGWASSRLSR